MKGIVATYGLDHTQVVEELLKVTEGELINHLHSGIDDWQSHSHISEKYWVLFRNNYPALADTLMTNF